MVKIVVKVNGKQVFKATVPYGHRSMTMTLVESIWQVCDVSIKYCGPVDEPDDNGTVPSDPSGYHLSMADDDTIMRQIGAHYDEQFK